MKNIAIIPARGGSKGIPEKNIIEFCGQPLIAHTITAAIKADSIDTVYVSTDSEAIAKIAKEYHAEVIMRPFELSGDAASSESALLHALEELDYQGEYVTFLQCTSPLTRSYEIDQAFQQLLTSGMSSIFSAIRFEHFAWKKDEEQRAIPIGHTMESRQRRQDLSPQYLENGGIYIMNREIFQREKNRFCGEIDIYLTKDRHTIEIDEPGDIALAEYLYRKKGD